MTSVRFSTTTTGVPAVDDRLDQRRGLLAEDRVHEDRVGPAGGRRLDDLVLERGVELGGRLDIQGRASLVGGLLGAALQGREIRIVLDGVDERDVLPGPVDRSVLAERCRRDRDRGDDGRCHGCRTRTHDVHPS